eukprot:2404978-Pyramimonas_sp.AAC.1
MDPPRRLRRKGSVAAPRASSPTARGLGDTVENIGGDRVGVPDTPPAPTAPRLVSRHNFAASMPKGGQEED